MTTLFWVWVAGGALCRPMAGAIVSPLQRGWPVHRQGKTLRPGGVEARAASESSSAGETADLVHGSTTLLLSVYEIVNRERFKGVNLHGLGWKRLPTQPGCHQQGDRGPGDTPARGSLPRPTGRGGLSG